MKVVPGVILLEEGILAGKRRCRMIGKGSRRPSGLNPSLRPVIHTADEDGISICAVGELIEVMG